MQRAKVPPGCRSSESEAEVTGSPADAQYPSLLGKCISTTARVRMKHSRWIFFFFLVSRMDNFMSHPRGTQELPDPPASDILCLRRGRRKSPVMDT